MSYRAWIFDRDGCLIHNNRSKKGGCYYLQDPNKIDWIDGAPELLDTVSSLKFKLLIVTMQNWIKSDSDHRLANDIMNRMLDTINIDGNRYHIGNYIDDYIICASSDESNESKAKAKANQIIFWAIENDIDLTESVAIGDAISDIMAYDKAGIGLKIQILLPFGDKASELADKTYHSLLDLMCDLAFNKITGEYLPKE